MEINMPLVDHLANLSRLHINETEKVEIMSDLSKMISFVEKLSEIDTTGVEPLTHISDSINAWREDAVRGSISNDAAFANAPTTDSNFFKVPKVIQK
jgi:aspartyl-tRNA(Asn)/glutamyl-tRNA(Gln) amidotransferase subunit C